MPGKVQHIAAQMKISEPMSPSTIMVCFMMTVSIHTFTNLMHVSECAYDMKHCLGQIVPLSNIIMVLKRSFGRYLDICQETSLSSSRFVP